MFTSLWLSSLKRQLRPRFTRNSRVRSNRNHRHSLPAARALVSCNVAEALEDRTLLTAFTVVNTDDSGAGSLRDAIEQANASAGADTIAFDAALAGETIVLTDEILISDNLTITGLGADQLTLDGNGDSRIFRVDDGSFETSISVSISGLTLTNGSASSGGAVLNLETLTIDDCTMTANVGQLYGGGVYSTRGTLTVTNSEFSENVSSYGGGLTSYDGSMTVAHSTFHQNEVNTYGGGIFYRFDNQVETTPLEVTDCTFTENVAASGSGICVSAGTLLLSNSSLSMNEAANGAGVFALLAEASISETTFSTNTGTNRGAIYSQLSNLTVTDSTFFQNQATNADSSASGGAISSIDGTLTVTNSMFEQNSAKSSGGAIHHNADASISVSGSTFLKNTAFNYGGAIYNTNSILDVVGSTFTENEAIGSSGSRGGAIYHSVNSSLEDDIGATISRSTFTKNSTESSGGGIYVTGGVVTIQESTFSENTAQLNGGGVNIASAEVTVENSTFSKNTAGSSGGGLFNYDTLLVSGSTFAENSAGLGGGAIYNSSSATIVNSTLSQNRAASSGGGVYAVGAIPLTVINSTIVLNSVTGIGSGGGIYSPYIVPTVSNSIVAGNTATNSAQVSGSFINNSSIVEESIDSLVDPLLRSSGGSTPTHLLLEGSAAINAGDNNIVTTAGLLHDQRGVGYARIYDGTVDVGAYEFNDHVLIVNTVSDADDGDYSYGNLSLREAVQLANESPYIDTIEFDATLLSGQTIVLTEEILISDDLTLVGLGAELLTLDGNADSRIFMIDDGNTGSKISVEISGLTLANGSADHGGAIYNYLETLSILDSTLSGNTASNSGGAIYSFYADLSIENSKLTGNIAGTEEMNGHGAGIYQEQGSLIIDSSEFSDNEAFSLGGGIYISRPDQAKIINSTFTSNEAQAGGAIYKSSGSLLIEDSDFTGNHGTGAALQTLGGSTHVSESEFSENVSPTNGGAIKIFTGSLTVSATTFTENRAAALGGGVDISSGDVIIQESTFTGNQANKGGAIGMLGRGSLELVSSTLSQNIVTFDGGAVYNNGAIALTIENSTLSENLAGFSGGALLTFANTDVSVINSTIVKNEATHFSGGGISRTSTSGSFLLSNSIVAGNTSNQISGSYTGSGNIVRSSIDGLIDPVLRDNGGLTKTHALPIGSAAIDAGNNSAALSAGLTKDQRGGIHHRIFNGTVDIGAYESYSGVLQVDSISDLDDGNYTRGHLTLREAIQIANATPEVDLITFKSTLSGMTIVLRSDLVISSSMNITGLGAELLTISGDNNSRIFTIDDGDTEVASVIDISQLNLINGTADQGGAIYNTESLTLADVVLSQNAALVSGGGIYNNEGDLLLDQVQFLDNTAGDLENPGYGAGLYQNMGTLSVIGSDFSGNQSTGSGGGIYSFAAEVFLISNSTFESNSSRTGGAISKTFGSLVITESRFSGNDAFEGQGGVLYSGVSSNDGIEEILIEKSLFSENTSKFEGGAIYLLGGRLTIEDSTFSDNSAELAGGAIHSLGGGIVTVGATTFDGNHSDKNGGAISLVGAGTFNLFSSTLSNNSANGRGGAIFSSAIGGSGTVQNTTISGNMSAGLGSAIYSPAFAAFSVVNSTIVGNGLTSVDGLGAIAVDPAFSTYSLFTIDNSIVAGNDGSQISGSFAGTNNIIQESLAGLVDPNLRDNGGPTKTHALLLESAAIDAGNNTAATSATMVDDQRGSGFTRIVGETVDIGAFEMQVHSAQLNLRIVEDATATSASGEASVLPEDRDWLSEWQGYWVEVWVTTTDISDLGLLSVSLDLVYNTTVTTATGIEYGAAFTLNQMGTINDLTGTVENLSATTGLDDVGADQHVLFARIHFAATTDDAIDLDLTGKSLNPQSPEFALSQAEIQLAGSLDSDELYGLPPATEIWANPYDLNDDDAINFRDLILFASVYGSTPSESHSDYSWFADFNQNNSVDFRDLISFASNYGKSKAGQASVNYPQNYPEAWNQLLIVDSQSTPQPSVNSVTQSAAETVLESVVDQVSPQLTPSQNETLAQVDIEVVDLAGETLGRAVPGTIYIDVNAAGRGWFVDASPADHSEFSYASDLTLIALPDSEAAGQVDLFTVILHELGHLLGYEHETAGVMLETLAPGVRHLSDWADDSDHFFADLTEDTSLIVF